MKIGFTNITSSIYACLTSEYLFALTNCLSILCYIFLFFFILHLHTDSILNKHHPPYASLMVNTHQNRIFVCFFNNNIYIIKNVWILQQKIIFVWLNFINIELFIYPNIVSMRRTQNAKNKSYKPERYRICIKKLDSSMMFRICDVICLFA